jgi:hypothetical protein
MMPGLWVSNIGLVVVSSFVLRLVQIDTVGSPTHGLKKRRQAVDSIRSLLT